MKPISLTLFAAWAASCLATSICDSPPYDLFLPLSALPQAESFCSSLYPLPPYTSTVEAPTATITQTSTVTTTSTTISTRIIIDSSTTGPTSTFLATTTITATVCSQTAPSKRGLKGRGLQRHGRTTSTETAAASTGTQSPDKKTTSLSTSASNGPIATGVGDSGLLSSLISQDGAVISTVCSCIETPLTTTVTTTPTVTIISTSTSTAFRHRRVKVTSTTTITESTTAIRSTTTTFTSTTTVALAAVATDCTQGSDFGGFTEMCSTDCNSGGPLGNGIFYTTATNFSNCINTCIEEANRLATTLNNIAFDYCSGDCNCFNDGSYYNSSITPPFKPDPQMACGFNQQGLDKV